MRDGISLESLGLPCAVIVTTEFVNESITQRAALGMDDLVEGLNRLKTFLG